MSNSPRFHVTVSQNRHESDAVTFYFVEAEDAEDAKNLVIAAGESLGITFVITKIEEAF